jgi:hypothetical protein
MFEDGGLADVAERGRVQDISDAALASV